MARAQSVASMMPPGPMQQLCNNSATTLQQVSRIHVQCHYPFLDAAGDLPVERHRAAQIANDTVLDSPRGVLQYGLCRWSLRVPGGLTGNLQNRHFPYKVVIVDTVLITVNMAKMD